MSLFCFCGVGDLEDSGRPYNIRDTHPVKWMADLRDLTDPDLWILIADADASFFGHFRRSGIGAVMGPEMRQP